MVNIYVSPNDGGSRALDDTNVQPLLDIVYVPRAL